MTAAADPYARLAACLRWHIADLIRWGWNEEDSPILSLREAAAVLEQRAEPAGAHRGELGYGPPYVGGDDDEITEWWGACSCGWKGKKHDQYGQSVASKDLIDHLNAALAAQPPAPPQESV